MFPRQILNTSINDVYMGLSQTMPLIKKIWKAALLYFDETPNVIVKSGLSFFACAHIFTLLNVKMCAQANKHHAKKN